MGKVTIAHQKAKQKMIKNTFILILLNLLVIGKLKSQPKSSLIGIQSGINYNMTFSNDENMANHSFQNGWMIGLNYEKFVSQKWSLNVEWNRTTNKTKIDNYSEFYNNSKLGLLLSREGDVVFNEKNNQFLVSFKRYLTRSKKIFFELGWDVKFIQKNLGTWNYVSTSYYDDSNFLDPVLLDEPEVKTVNTTYSRNGGYIGINLGIGYRYEIANRIQVLAKSRFSNQLKKPNESGEIILRHLDFVFGIQFNLTNRSKTEDDLELK